MSSRMKKWLRRRIEKLNNIFFGRLKQEVNSEIIREIREGTNSCNTRIKIAEEKVTACYDRIEIVEQNLNYYNMIRDIQKEYDYVNLELLQFKKNSRNNVLLVGFYGAYNLGDELMLQSLFGVLQARKDIHVTVMLCDNAEYDYGHFHDVSIIHYPKTMLDYNVLAQQYDYIIWGGGALIDDTQYDSRNVKILGNMLLDLSKRFIIFNKKCVMLGLSSNKHILNEQYIETLKYVIQNSMFFSVRDSYTKDVLVGLGVTEEKIHNINDLVFANPIWRKPIEKRKNEKIFIGIVLITLEENRLKLKEILQAVYETACDLYGTQFELRCIPFYNYNNQDVKFYETLIQDVNNNIVICRYKNSITEIREEFNELDFVVSMRYHATLISQILGIPSLSVCMNEHPHYYNKMRAITEMANNKESLIGFEEMERNEFCDIIRRRLCSRFSSTFDSNVLHQAETDLENVIEFIFGSVK